MKENQAEQNWLSLSWVKHHRRSEEIAQALGFTPYFIRGKSEILPLRYAQQALHTYNLLKSTQPTVILVMQPPPLALLSAWLYARNKHIALIGDLHTGTFSDPKWRWASRWVLATLEKRGGALVPNEELATKCRIRGVTTYVCHGYLRAISNSQKGSLTNCPDGGQDRRFVLVPLTYSFDEPVAEILDAARLTPDLEWVLTGNAPSSVTALAPKNVRFTGFVSRNDYLNLRLEARLVVALTTIESTMQSAGYEALAAGTPLVTSPTRVLRDYFGEAASYAEPNAESIAERVRHTLENNAEATSGMQELLARKSANQSEHFRTITSWIGTLTNTSAKADK
jgi:glycosyltransferase involved in cell wall biosynthesis